jgi:hypothetical protein
MKAPLTNVIWAPDLELSEECVTLIAAWNREAHVLIAADTGATAPGVTLTSVKVWRIPSRPLMWGYAGQEVYGEFLRPFMEGELPSTWADLRDYVGDATRAANAKAHEDSRKAGLKDAPPENLTTVLVAGFVGSEPRVLESHPNGMTGFSSTPESYIGSGVQFANLANSTAMRLAGSDVERLEAVMESVARWQPFASQLGLAEPIEYWRITANDVEQRVGSEWKPLTD